MTTDEMVKRTIRNRWQAVAAAGVVVFLCILLRVVADDTVLGDVALLVLGTVVGAMTLAMALAQKPAPPLPDLPREGTALYPPPAKPRLYGVADGSTSVAVYDGSGKEVSRGRMPIDVGPTVGNLYLTVLRDTLTDMGYTPIGRPVEHHGACGCVEYEVTAARYPVHITDLEGRPTE